MMSLMLTALLAMAPAPAAEDKKDRMVCKRDDATGSRLGAKRICKRASEWAAYYKGLDPNGRALDPMGSRVGGIGNYEQAARR